MTPSTRRFLPVPRPDRPARPGGSRLRKAAIPLLLVAGAILLGGCSAPTFGAFRGATTQGKDEFKLWVGMFIAGLIVAGIVYILIFWASFAYRRRRHGEDYIPKQFHSNVPLEIVYTALPIIIVGFIFYFTVLTENNVDAVSNHPNEVVNVLAYRWGWQFTYESGSSTPQGVVIRTSAQPELLPKAATSSEYPQLVLPVGETVRINLASSDVIHGFYVPEFNFSRYAQPGVTNTFDFTPTTTGVYTGQCTQYCGLYHSEMLFSVKVVSASQFQQWLSTQQASQAQGAVS